MAFFYEIRSSNNTVLKRDGGFASAGGPAFELEFQGGGCPAGGARFETLLNFRVADPLALRGSGF
jgi:hypothetical protein